MNLVDLVVVQREPGDLVEGGEGAVQQDADVVLAEVEVLQLPGVAEGKARHLAQPVVGQHQVLQLGVRERVGAEGLEIWKQ